MTHDEELTLLKELSLIAVSIESVEAGNFKPHPYCITPKHLELSPSHILDHNSIREAESRGAKCGVPKCKLSIDEHTSETAIFVRPLYDVEKEAIGNNGRIGPRLMTDFLAIKKCITDNKMSIDGIALLPYEET